ncbi:electron transfer protein with DM13 domain [Haloferula helveola]|uniref:Electron transfer protein with DM13 domain n=1 Tax=Haloferula helveola TaxID=490095 RepID=A0ABM7RFG2_9BACT|nr:electron transfer protein with DM13 domain [Haloferula helveola]
MKRSLKIPLFLVAAGVFAWLVFGVFGIQALFIDRKVEEQVPEAVMSLVSGQDGGSASTDAERALLGKGSFRQGDSTYTISGDAFLSRINGQLNLTFTGFDVTNGPDLFVYAVKSSSTDNQEVKSTVSEGGFINLGTLKGNIGDQNYALEDGLDLEDYPVISIWCRRFGRNFGSALIEPEPIPGSP